MSFNRKRTGAHSQIPRTSDWDIAIDIDGGKGQLRDHKNLSAFVYQRFSKERRIPRPYPASKFTWDPKRNIARLPSVKVIGGHPTPPMRQLSPQISIDGQQFATKRSTDDFRSQYPDLSERKIVRREYQPMRRADWAPFSKWFDSKVGFLSGQIRAGGGRYLQNRPILCAVRNNINKFVRRR